MTTHPEYRIIAGSAADAERELGAVVLTIRSGRIGCIEPFSDAVRPEPGDVDCRRLTLIPGFIDIHVHGGAGHYVMDGTAAGLRSIARHLARHGVTGFLSTTITDSWERQKQAVAVAGQQMKAPENGLDGAAVLGVHLEGPYINPAKKGAQPAEHIRRPDVGELVSHLGDNIEALKVVTLAPEMPGALDLIRFLTGRGIVSSIGHTDATYEQVCDGISAGAKHVTHCFNAMRQMEGRQPGVVGAALSRNELTAELIWDNIHVHPASCSALIHAKSADRVILISDGIPGAGMQDGYRFALGDHPVVVQNGAARLADGTLAGSLLTIDRAFSNASNFSLCERASMSSRNAAAALGLGEHKGLLKPDFDADLALLDESGVVLRTIVAGRIVYEAIE